MLKDNESRPNNPQGALFGYNDYRRTALREPRLLLRGRMAAAVDSQVNKDEHPGEGSPPPVNLMDRSNLPTAEQPYAPPEEKSESDKDRQAYLSVAPSSDTIEPYAEQ